MENVISENVVRHTGFMLLQWIGPESRRMGGTEVEIWVEADGGATVAVYAENARDAGTRSSPVAVVPFGRGDDAGDALAALMAAVYATDGQGDFAPPDPAGVADHVAGDGRANVITAARLMTALPDEELPGVLEALEARAGGD